MAKGKKFTAAEKHFHEKEISYRKEIRKLEETLAEARLVIVNLAKENVNINEALAKATAERDEAIKLSNLSVEELQKHIESTQNVSQVFDMLTTMNKYI